MVVNPALTLGSFLVAIMVGLTGMGGGALLTPMLMLVFGVPPLAAVSSDLVASAVTKPVGALVHLRRGTVHLRLAAWLSAGSVPAAFLGGLLGWWLGRGGEVQTVTARATGAVLVIAAVGVVAKTLIRLAGTGSARADGSANNSNDRAHTGATGASNRAHTGMTGASNHAPGAGTGERDGAAGARPSFFVRRIPTLLIGILVGLAVGVTSTGSGTLVIAALAALYPALPAARLVGTDLAQAAPMVFAAAAAHLVAGDVHLSVTAPLLIGGVPGVIVGSLLATRVPGGLLRPFLSVVILASGLSLFGLSPLTVGLILIVAVSLPGAAAVARRRHTRTRAAPTVPPAGPSLRRSPGKPAASPAESQ